MNFMVIILGVHGYPDMKRIETPIESCRDSFHLISSNMVHIVIVLDLWFHQSTKVHLNDVIVLETVL